jgi:outer membrane protein assembly factor BamA
LHLIKSISIKPVTDLIHSLNRQIFNKSLFALILLCTSVLTPELSFGQHTDSVSQTNTNQKYLWNYLQWETDIPVRIQKQYTKKLLHFPDTVGLNQRTTKLLEHLKSKGYAGARVDTFYSIADTPHISIYKGWQFKYSEVEISGISQEAWQNSGFSTLRRKKAIYSRIETERRFSAILNYYQNQGYPFASLSQQEIYIKADTNRQITQIGFNYKFNSGLLYKIDSILLEGRIREKPRFVENMIRMHSGDIYRYQEIKDIPGILNNSIYYQQAKPVQELFSDDGKVKLLLNMQSRKASRFDGLIGLLPPAENTAKIQLTGLLDFMLVSPFASGEIISFKFEQLPSQSQRLALKYQQPWLFNLPLKAETELNLFKQDSTFLNRFFKLTPYWMLSPKVQIKGWYRNKTSVILNTTPWKNSKLIPPVLDSQEGTFGFGIEYEKLDYRINPSKGLILKFDAGAGQRNIRQNPGLDSLDYTSIRLTYPSREIQFEMQWFLSPFKRHVVLIGNRSFRMDQVQYFRNELLQIGGARTLRGFNENQFFARYYSVFTLEYRFLLDENSNLFAFYDQARLELREPGFIQTLNPAGIGTGINFETRAGILNLTFATGQVGDIKFSPSRPRVHFGIVSMF